MNVHYAYDKLNVSPEGQLLNGNDVANRIGIGFVGNFGALCDDDYAND